jgi:tetratricopeptide (TPR) repeat protein
MKRLLIITSVILISFATKSQLAEQQRNIEQASQAYTATDYQSAISQYESVINAGYESSVLYFNLGNAYFKSNDIPSAILFYEKARKLDPTDENIRFNLELANSRIIDKLDPLPEFFLRVWYKSVRNYFTSDQWAKISVTCFILLLITAASFIISASVNYRKISFWTGIIFLSFMVLSLIFSISSYHEYSAKSSAIIFTPTVTVKSSPNETSVDLFVIHEGTKVMITDEVEGWSEVRIGNGSVGWLKSSTYRTI